MKSYCILPLSDPKSRWLSSLIISISLVCGVYLVRSACLRKDFMKFSPVFGQKAADQDTISHECKENWRPMGTEALPKGIVSVSSNLEMHPLWGPVSENNKSHHPTGLLAMAVGIDQKGVVNQIVKKFLENDFVVMLFHYDGVVEKWNDLEWSDKAIHVSVVNQTKWWFAKRFLHPDIVNDYEYVFLWDEDLKLDNFHPARYLSIVKEEGLEISQPALDPGKSVVHHPITVRRQRSRCHRRYYKFKGSGRCYGNSTAPPCVGWVELMAPVFSRAAWRCVWHLIQNDLIHAWGLDRQLGYCAQGDRTVKVGVVDEEYIVHLGLPTLGGFLDRSKEKAELGEDHRSSRSKSMSDSESLEGDMYKFDNRSAVRLRSYIEMGVFRDRWNKAVSEDECWVDPFKQPACTTKC
ncbi:hypothetical protein AAHA92_13948 [Salvia divinorum]|uniref:Uncharacterized protein n=1 Tax=Salvia divinorum TaxID=28513 RepID=A0ABD1HCM2_SALDI